MLAVAVGIMAVVICSLYYAIQYWHSSQNDTRSHSHHPKFAADVRHPDTLVSLLTNDHAAAVRTPLCPTVLVSVQAAGA